MLKRDFKQAKQDGWDKQPRDSDGYEGHVLENADFEEYYKAQVLHLCCMTDGRLAEHACQRHDC